MYRQLSFLSNMALINFLSYHNYVNVHVGRVSFEGGGDIILPSLESLLPSNVKIHCTCMRCGHDVHVIW